jgi:hypothetical protein
VVSINSSVLQWILFCALAFIKTPRITIRRKCHSVLLSIQIVLLNLSSSTIVISQLDDCTQRTHRNQKYNWHSNRQSRQRYVSRIPLYSVHMLRNKRREYSSHMFRQVSLISVAIAMIRQTTWFLNSVRRQTIHHGTYIHVIVSFVVKVIQRNSR